ncbi:MAG: gluconokinase [Pyrinomonadaceae bacterium]
MMKKVPDRNNFKQEPYALALDVGSSSVRAALYDAEGNEIEGTAARINRNLSTTVEGGAELDADEALAQVSQTIDDALKHSSQNISRIEIVALSCFWHSLVGIDEAGRALTPVYTWADTRAARAAEELKKLFNERETHNRTGCRFHPSYWPAKLLRLRQERKEVYRSVRRWMSFAEFLTLRLFGATAASVSMASGTGLFDVRRCRWDEQLLDGLEISTRQLTKIAAPRESFTNLKDEYARRWPQLQNARWFPAIGDGAANNIGAGCTTLDRAALMIGTSGAMRVLWEGLSPESLPCGLWCYRADERRVVLGGALSDGGGLYAWMKNALALNEDEDRVERELSELEPDAHGLTILPFWAGERSTGWHADARGAILGLTQHTRPPDILRAAMEAIAYRFALIANELKELAPQVEIIASGGALVASRVWTQIIADVLGVPVKLSLVQEASSRGAVLLALEATGKIKRLEDAPTQAMQTFEPDAARHARYQTGIKRQQKIYERLIADEEIARSLSDASTHSDKETKRA